MVGATVGKYEILSEIGRGGTGVVYLARQRDLERKVALKALHGPDGLSTGTGLALVSESRLAGSLNHPNIVTVYEYLGEAGTSYIAMEYVARGSLRLWMGYLSLPQLAGVLEGLLAGLGAVAPRGIVHRDLKPENIMVTDEGRVKIADFGIAKATQAAGIHGLASSTGGVTVGTPAYMAPEQALCEEVGPWTDLYSVGVMAYEYLLGYVPFHDTSSPMGMLLRRINDPIPAPADVDTTVDRALSNWVARLLVREPSERISSAVTAWEELEEIVIGLLGPRWRRDARLINVADPDPAPETPTPTYFTSQQITLQTVAKPDVRSKATVQFAETQRLVRTRRQPRRARLRMVALVGLILMAAAGFAVARAGQGATSSTSGTRVASSGATLSLPAGWRAASTASPTPGYKISTPLTLISPHHDGSLTLGISSAVSAALLPVGLTSPGHPEPNRESISLNGKAFFRYPAVTLSGQAGAATLYTQPTTAGVLVGVCRLPSRASTAVSLGCEQILGTLTLAKAHALPIDRSVRYVTVLAGLFNDFNSERSRLGERLARAQSAQAQAAAAGRLGEAARHSAAALQAARPGPSESASNRALTSALDRMASGYEQMSTAAHDAHAAAYEAGAHAVSASADALQVTLKRLASTS